MGKQGLWAGAVTVAVVLAGMCASASASIVTLGPQLGDFVYSSSCEEAACTVFQTALPETGAQVTSPVSGAVIRWHLLGGDSTHKYKLRVVTHNSGLLYTGSGSSAPVTPAAPTVQTFATALPIQAGQLIGLDLEAGGRIAYAEVPGAQYAGIVGSFPDGATQAAFTGTSNPWELGFNAEVLPAPTIASIAPATGSIQGGTAVAVSGANFAEVKGVSFGSVPAASFTVGSESQITAVALPSAAVGPVSISVTTIAGTATAPQQFAYAGCTVPSLHGKTLKAAKKRIRAAGCKVGEVRRKRGVTAKTGKVVKQAPKAGGLRPPGTKVNVKLG